MTGDSRRDGGGAERTRQDEREASLGRIIEESLNEVYVFDAETLRFRLVNRGARENLGYSLDELRELTPIDLKPEFTAELFEKTLAPLRTGGKGVIEFSTVHRRKDGTLYPVEVHLQLTHFEGRPAFVAIILDTTERKRIEDELQNTLERTQSIIDSAVEGILSIDENGTIESANPAALEIFGYKRDELLGQDVEVLMVPPDRDEHGGRVAKYLRTGRSRILGTTREVTGRRRDGSTFPLELSVSEGRVRGRRVFTGVLRDLTERQVAERSLRQASEIIDRVHDMVIATDTEGRITLWNRAAELTFETPRISALGRPISDFVPQEVIEAVAAKLEQNDRVEQRYELETARGLRIHENIFQRLRDDDDDVVGGIAFTRDVTSEVAAEEKRREAERRARAAEELAALSTLTAGIAHDVGTPMNVILGYSQLLEKSLTDEKHKRHARTISSQVQRVSELIQTLLNVARPKDVTAVPVKIADVVDTSLGFFREKLRKHSIEVERRFEPVPDISGDPDRLQQVFLNLFVNAADAMPEGGTLAVDIDEPEPGQVRVRVSDTGFGFDEETRQQIFDPFFTTKGRGKGNGLGLVVTRGIILDHGGDIEVASEEGRGTCFTLRLPASPD